MPRKPTAAKAKRNAPPTGRKPPANALQIQLRIDKVMDLLLHGVSRGQIVKAGAKEWDVTERTVDTYIREAKDALAAQAEKRREVLYGLAYARLENLYQRSLSISDFKNALGVVKELNSLAGLYPDGKTQIEGGLSITIRYEDSDAE